jgi:hypothetical protein
MALSCQQSTCVDPYLRRKYGVFVGISLEILSRVDAHSRFALSKARAYATPAADYACAFAAISSFDFTLTCSVNANGS